MASKPLDPVEEEAREILERHLGVPVKQHDDNLGGSLPDLRIEYPDRERGLVEVVRDVESHALPASATGVSPNRVQQNERISRGGQMLTVPGLASDWMVVLTVAAMDVRAIRKAIPALLVGLEHRGERHLDALPWSEFDPAAFQLFQLGVQYVQAMNKASGDGTVILIAPNAGTWDGRLDHVPDWCAMVLAREKDVPAKLAAAECSERHAFLVATSQGDLSVYRSLGMSEVVALGRPALPTVAPDLPTGVDRVWVRGPGRVIAWAIDTGWIEIQWGVATHLPQ